MRHPVLLRVCVSAALVALAHASVAQPPGVPRPPRSARAGAQVDLTGNWVAQITEDWRWRMITPPKGDYASVPLNGQGRQAADRWDLASDDAAGEQCRAYGAGGIMRQPTRLKIAWADEDTLKVETDAGRQVRLFHFAGKAPADATPSWQGWSAAEWTIRAGFDPLAFFVAPTREATSARAGGAAPPPAAARPPPGPPPAPQGALKVVTSSLRPGYLRKNGVPYSGEAVVTEYYDRLSMFGNDYLQVVTVVTDPVYLTTPFTVSNQFKREPDDSKWHPTPCVTDPPLGTFHPPANPL